MPLILDDNQDRPQQGFDLFRWFADTLDKLRGISNPVVRERLAKFANGRMRQVIQLQSPYAVRAGSVKLKIPGLRIDPQTVLVQPELSNAFRNLNSPERQRRLLE